MPKALIVSLGGTTEPIIKSIEEHKPDYIFFLVSKESNAKEYPKVKAFLDENGFSPEIDFGMVKDVDDLVHCYEIASELATAIEKEGIPNEEVIVDYTGGTKTMSAALVLATVTKGYKFSYVGGKERTKSGLGVVVSGFEEVKTGLSPWRVLLVEERKKIALFLNGYQFSAARDIARKLTAVLGGLDKAIYESLSELIEGYRLWDSFEHKTALTTIERSKDKLAEHLRYKSDGILSGFLERVNLSLGFLKDMSDKTKNFKDIHIYMVFDLFYNAKRRAEEGKYDDAVARLYRALEMIGQVEFQKKFGCPTSDVKVEELPESLRDEMKRKHTAHDGKVRIPLYDTFRVLSEANNRFGQLFFEREDEINKILGVRNSSILAHGVTPVSKEAFEKLSAIVDDLLKKTGADNPVEFPKLSWE
ncbi:MAG TPA: TIGR02710 family CRISPR-associated CARF protein [Thermodesulfobacteriota bacterium]|nr:TIGR02710 family CRISPR-associated CARF protein [Thermodesulfobacteriota bacterium]